MGGTRSHYDEPVCFLHFRSHHAWTVGSISPTDDLPFCGSCYGSRSHDSLRSVSCHCAVQERNRKAIPHRTVPTSYIYCRILGALFMVCCVCNEPYCRILLWHSLFPLSSHSLTCGLHGNFVGKTHSRKQQISP